MINMRAESRYGYKKKMFKDIVLNSVIMTVLLYFAWEDIKHQSIARKELAAAGIAALIFRLSQGSRYHINMMYPAVFAVALLMLFGVTGCLGTGDLAVFAILAVVKGSIFMVETFIFSITVLLIYAWVMKLARRMPLKRTVPFLPYICISALGVMVCA